MKKYVVYYLDACDEGIKLYPFEIRECEDLIFHFDGAKEAERFWNIDLSYCRSSRYEDVPDSNIMTFSTKEEALAYVKAQLENASFRAYVEYEYDRPIELAHFAVGETIFYSTPMFAIEEEIYDDDGDFEDSETIGYYATDAEIKLKPIHDEKSDDYDKF